MRRTTTLMIVVTACFFVTSSGWAKEKPYKRIRDLIDKKGRAPVIVVFEVEGIDALWRESTENQAPDRELRPDNDTIHGPGRKLADKLDKTSRKIRNRLPRNSFKHKKTFKIVPAMAMKIDARALDMLSQDPQVISIHEDELSRVPPFTSSETEPAIDTPSLTDSTQLVRADDTWSKGYTGKGVYVAVLDTGVLTGHEMFAGKKIVEACYSTNYPTYHSFSVCPNGGESQVGSGAAAPTVSHGTHVAGIAVGKNAGPSANEPDEGVAPGADLIAVQVFSGFTGESACGKGVSVCYLSWSSDQISGLEYVYGLRNQYRIASANLSLGGGASGSYCDADPRKTIIDQLRAAKIATVIAAGNNGYCGYVSSPGCISSAVTVGASDKQDNEAGFNNWHPSVLDVFAPGVSIQSSIASGVSAYAWYSGTSMAAPHTAGAFALLTQANPGANMNTKESALKSKGKAISTTCTYPTGNKSRIDVYRAVNSIAPPPPPPPPPPRPPGKGAAAVNAIINLLLLSD